MPMPISLGPCGAVCSSDPCILSPVTAPHVGGSAVSAGLAVRLERGDLVHLPIRLPVYLSTYLPTYLPTYLHTCLRACLPASDRWCP
jgi:hypothetical protein